MFFDRLSNVLIAACLLVTIALSCFAAEALTVKDIANLLRAKLPDSVILAKAKQSTLVTEVPVAGRR